MWISNLRKIDLLKELIQNQKCNPEIETAFTLTGKTLFSDINNASVLALYYAIKGQIDLSKKHIDFVLSNGSCFTELVSNMMTIEKKYFN